MNKEFEGEVLSSSFWEKTRHNKVLPVGLLLLCSLSFNFYQHYQVTKLLILKDILVQKDAILDEGYNELIVKHLDSLKQNDIELAKNQGVLEGIISVVCKLKPEEDQRSSIWHAGYYSGLKQTNDVQKAAYEEGYAKGLKKAVETKTITPIKTSLKE